jgi:hypothetical protein
MSEAEGPSTYAPPAAATAAEACEVESIPMSEAEGPSTYAPPAAATAAEAARPLSAPPPAAVTAPSVLAATPPLLPPTQQQQQLQLHIEGDELLLLQHLLLATPGAEDAEQWLTPLHQFTPTQPSPPPAHLQFLTPMTSLPAPARLWDEATASAGREAQLEGVAELRPLRHQLLEGAEGAPAAAAREEEQEEEEEEEEQEGREQQAKQGSEEQDESWTARASIRRSLSWDGVVRGTPSSCGGGGSDGGKEQDYGDAATPGPITVSRGRTGETATEDEAAAEEGEAAAAAATAAMPAAVAAAAAAGASEANGGAPSPLPAASPLLQPSWGTPGATAAASARYWQDMSLQQWPSASAAGASEEDSCWLAAASPPATAAAAGAEPSAAAWSAEAAAAGASPSIEPPGPEAAASPPLEAPQAVGHLERRAPPRAAVHSRLEASLQQWPPGVMEALEGAEAGSGVTGISVEEYFQAAGLDLPPLSEAGLELPPLSKAAAGYEMAPSEAAASAARSPSEATAAAAAIAAVAGEGAREAPQGSQPGSGPSLSLSSQASAGSARWVVRRRGCPFWDPRPMPGAPRDAESPARCPQV